jgi:transcriptional regulator with XRE-family HTH domain
MDDLSLVKTELSKLDYSGIERVSVESGVPAGTITKVRSGETSDPRYNTVKRLANYFRAKASREQEARA